jgi:hypothetical protein
MQLKNEKIGVSSGLEEIELEMVIRGPPPHWCACKCPEYMRDPCLACEIREVTSIDHALLSPEEAALYLIPKSELEKILTKQKGGE